MIFYFSLRGRWLGLLAAEDSLCIAKLLAQVVTASPQPLDLATESIEVLALGLQLVDQLQFPLL